MQLGWKMMEDIDVVFFTLIPWGDDGLNLQSLFANLFDAIS